ncbi:MAG: methyltransferase domain-containing protein [Acidobacteria bacterium]|nr:methyltransferase domain-containing protein [Acidobacteriota bacterium]
MEAPRIFDPNYYQRLADVERRHWWSRGMLALAGDFLVTIAPDGLLLDAGCGTGGQLRRLPQQWRERSLGIDISPHALRLCRGSGFERPLLQSSIASLPFRDQVFYCVICNDVLQHVTQRNLDGALSEIRRVLKRGGFLVMRSNSRMGFRAGGSTEADFRRFLLRELEAILDSNGFKILTASYVNCLPSLGSLLRRPAAEGYSGLQIRPLPPHLGWLNSLLYWYMRLEALVVTKGIRLPYGQSTFVLARRGR